MQHPLPIHNRLSILRIIIIQTDKIPYSALYPSTALSSPASALNPQFMANCPLPILPVIFNGHLDYDAIMKSTSTDQ